MFCSSATSTGTTWISGGSTFLKHWLQYKTQGTGKIVQCTNRIGKMEAPKKYIFLVGLLVVLGIAGLEKVHGAGECGKAPVEREAWKLAPCALAAQDAQAEVSDRCCLQVKKMGQNPSCLCAVMLSQTAKSSGVKPEIAVTIPKRCNLADRPVGYKCGGKVFFVEMFLNFIFPVGPL